MSIALKLKELGSRFTKAKKTDGEASSKAAVPEVIVKKPTRTTGVSSSLMRALIGGTSEIGAPYFPPEVVAGCCPRIVGEEDDIVWNAAAEACDTERVHVVWQSFEDRIWYLAVRSSELSSNPNSWCPFASVLPGMKDAQPAPVCYTYYGDEMASLLAVTKDGLQIFRGTNLIVRAKAERTAREMGASATVVEMVQDHIQTLTPVPWYAMSLFEDRARRILATSAVVISVGFAVFTFFVWLLASLSLISARHNLTEALQRTESKTMQLLNDVQKLRASPLREQVANFTDLNDGLLDLTGFLEVYELKAGKARWRASVPSNVTADRINALGGKTIETKPTGTEIGNAAEIAYEASVEGKR